MNAPKTIATLAREDRRLLPARWGRPRPRLKAVRGRLYKLIGYEPHYDDTPLRILLVHHNKEVLQAPSRGPGLPSAREPLRGLYQ